MMDNVPRGTILETLNADETVIERLKIYEAVLRKWNPKINLVSPNSLNEIWERHLLDSLQLLRFFPRGISSALDIGSGGGFPALVLAAATPETQWTLIESDQRKCVFLRTAAREMGVNVLVKSERIEQVDQFTVHLITARALADLNQLFSWCDRFSSEDTVLLFPKGKSWQMELTPASENWQMVVEDFASLTDREARILRVTNLERRLIS